MPNCAHLSLVFFVFVGCDYMVLENIWATRSMVAAPRADWFLSSGFVLNVPSARTRKSKHNSFWLYICADIFSGIAICEVR